MVTGNVAVLAVLYVSGAQSIPDARYLSILVIGTLNLVSGTGRTPKEIFRKLIVVSFRLKLCKLCIQPLQDRVQLYGIRDYLNHTH